MDYRDTKSEYGQIISILEAKLTTTEDDPKNIEGLLEKEIDNLLELNNCFENAGWGEFRSIIGSISPENLTFDGFTY